ncbi:MAG TPA: hypothetical protein VFQ39_01085 [Longimicrobium sp.]|nr:hypothetical protein [Longimicrobium sp.]
MLALAACADRTPTTSRPVEFGRREIDLPVDAPVDALCTGTASSGFSPALTNQNQAVTVTIERNYSCVLGASSGVMADTISQPALDCVAFLEGAPPSDEVITWTGGTGPSTSTVHYTSVTGAYGVATYQGTVTAGRFQGDAVIQELAITSAQGSGIPQACSLGLGTVARYSGTIVSLKVVDTSVLALVLHPGRGERSTSPRPRAIGNDRVSPDQRPGARPRPGVGRLSRTRDVRRHQCASSSSTPRI